MNNLLINPPKEAPFQHKTIRDFPPEKSQHKYLTKYERKVIDTLNSLAQVHYQLMGSPTSKLFNLLLQPVLTAP